MKLKWQHLMNDCCTNINNISGWTDNLMWLINHCVSNVLWHKNCFAIPHNPWSIWSNMTSMSFSLKMTSDWNQRSCRKWPILCLVSSDFQTAQAVLICTGWIKRLVQISIRPPPALALYIQTKICTVLFCVNVFNSFQTTCCSPSLFS